MDNVKVVHLPKKKVKAMQIKTEAHPNLISHEDVVKSLKRERRERNKRYRSWLGWYWKAYDWCFWTFWSILRSTPLKETKWFFQRGSRGWSDCDAWGGYNYLAKITSEMTAYLARIAHGYPDNTKDIKEWKTILKKISKAFKLVSEKDRYVADLWKRDAKLARQCDMQTNKEYVKVEEGWHLYRRWFYNLWD